jgi:sterol desaturase/sphingolipid hydroxylase (fatty acid hydroxylase superfamily)
MIQLFATDRLGWCADSGMFQTLYLSTESSHLAGVGPQLRCFVILRAWTGRNLRPGFGNSRPSPTGSSMSSNGPHRHPWLEGTSILVAGPRRLGSALLDAIIRMSSTRTNYWLEFVFTIALSTTLLGTGVRLHRGIWAAAFATVLAGLIAFSFIEYLFHRWIFHGPESMYRRGHDSHHKDPHGYDGLPFFLPAAILLGLAILFALLIPTSHACLLVGSIGFGYVAYGLSHFAIHATRFRQPWIRHWAARHHIHHHLPDRNFGVTTSLWDHVLRTRHVPRRAHQESDR